MLLTQHVGNEFESNFMYYTGVFHNSVNWPTLNSQHFCNFTVSVRTISFTHSEILCVLLSVDILRFQHLQQEIQQFWTCKNHPKLVFIPLFALQKVISTFLKFSLHFSLVRAISVTYMCHFSSLPFPLHAKNTNVTTHYPTITHITALFH